MKKILSIATIILFGCPLNLIANTPTIASENIIIWPGKGNNPKRPKLPTRQIIQCIYQNGSLYFQFAIAEGECQLTVTDMTTGFARQYVFDSSADATINVGTLTQAHIEISTANGHEYEGWLGME